MSCLRTAIFVLIFSGVAWSYIPSGFDNKVYNLVSPLNDRCVSVEGSSIQDGARIEIDDCDKGPSQKISISRLPGDKGVVSLRFAHSERCLAQSDGVAEQLDCASANAKLFLRKHSSYYLIQSAKGSCLKISGGSKVAGSRLEWADCFERISKSGGLVNEDVLLYPESQSSRFFIKEATDNPGPQGIEPLVLTYMNKDYESDPSNHTNNLIRSLKKWGWNYEVLGVGTTWRGFGDKFIGYQNKLKELPEDQLVLLVDATDVLANGGPEGFIRDFLRLSQYKSSNRIISSSEIGCCVGPLNRFQPGAYRTPDGEIATNSTSTGKQRRGATLWEHDYDNSRTSIWENALKRIKEEEGYRGELESPFHYLNSGMIAGFAKDLLNMFNYLDALQEEDDQALLTEYHLRFPERVKVDYTQTLFSNANFWDNETGCFFEYDGKKIENTLTHTFPAFIQTPGKFWSCYERLLKASVNGESLLDKSAERDSGHREMPKSGCNSVAALSPCNETIMSMFVLLLLLVGGYCLRFLGCQR